MKKAPRRPKPAALGADSPTSSRVVHSARILGDACEKFQNYCIDDIELDIEQINQYVRRWLMLVSALSPVIGIVHRPSPTTPTAADALCGKLPWTPAR